MPKDDTLLPTIPEGPLKSTLTSVPLLQPDATIKEAKVSDVEMLNDQLIMAYQAIPEIKSIGSYIALSTHICNLIFKRRDVLRIPYGTENKVSKSNTLDHID